MTNDQLVELILPWAKEHHPDKYEKTVAQAANPFTFRKFLIRLIEIRCAEDHEFRNTKVPLSVLEESSMQVTLRNRKLDQRFTVGGEGVVGRSFTFRLLEMCLEPDARANGMLATVLETIQAFDLVAD